MDVVVDTSALVAVATGEAAGSWVFETLDQTESRVMSAGSVLELSIVLTHRFGPVGPAVAQQILRQGQIEEVPFDADQVHLATVGYLSFGKGIHPAALNFGDCFVYGLARSRKLAVVCLGDDFPQTDLETIHPD